MAITREDAKVFAAEIAEDLLHLEITLAGRKFTNRIKAPDPATQMADIAQCYRFEIEDIRREWSAQPELRQLSVGQRGAAQARAMPPRSDFEKNDAQGLRDSFAWLEQTAAAELDELRKPENVSARAAFVDATALSQIDSQEQRLRQVRDSSKRALQVLEEVAGQDRPRDPRLIMRIRKEWELRPGDEIYMRTVIGMDGDVVALVNPDFAGERYAHLHKLHDESVEASAIGGRAFSTRARNGRK